MSTAEAPLSPAAVAATSPTVDALVQLSFAVQSVLTRVAAANELSVSQVRLLGILRDRTPSMAAIADVLELDRSSVSGLVDRAERRGLVARATSVTDARVTLVSATELGQQVSGRVATAVSAGLEQLVVEGSVSDLAALERLVGAIARNADRILGS